MKNYKLTDRKTYDVYFKEEGSGIEDVVVLNAYNKAEIRKIMRTKFKEWKIRKILIHEKL